MERIQAHRTLYASLITSKVGLTTESKLAEAFASTPRERFVGKGPWKVHTGAGYIETPTDDPALLYQDIVVSLREEGELNNGQPSLHALCISALGLQTGSRVVQVGAGTGYYTAILAKMVGESGSVDAYEVQPGFAARAAENLAEFLQVKMHFGSGTEGPLPKCDAIYVNAASTSPLSVWLEALSPMGRLIFPLTPAEGAGAMLLIIKQRTVNAPARFLCQTLFAPCIGGRREETAQKLTSAFRDQRWTQVRSFRRNSTPDKSCWFSDEDWWLSTDILTSD
jgi:protein-L-isoaspartate(D-aspartate) O-methyltransferase